MKRSGGDHPQSDSREKSGKTGETLTKQDFAKCRNIPGFSKNIPPSSGPGGNGDIRLRACAELEPVVQFEEASGAFRVEHVRFILKANGDEGGKRVCDRRFFY